MGGLEGSFADGQQGLALFQHLGLDPQQVYLGVTLLTSVERHRFTPAEDPVLYVPDERQFPQPGTVPSLPCFVSLPVSLPLC